MKQNEKDAIQFALDVSDHLSSLTYYEKDQTDVYYGKYKGKLCLYFPGTNIKQKEDIINDLNCFLYHDQKWKIRYHMGFKRAYEKIKEFILSIVKYDDSIYIFGHSLGGALAVLIGIDLWNIKKQVTILSFGCPRIGDKTFTNFLQRISLLHYRVVNGIDLITHLPPWWLGYKHCGQKIRIGNRWAFWRYLWNHNLSEYKKRFLEKCDYVDQIAYNSGIPKRIINGTEFGK